MLEAILFQDTNVRLRLPLQSEGMHLHRNSSFSIFVVLLSTFNEQTKSWHLYSCLARQKYCFYVGMHICRHIYPLMWEVLLQKLKCTSVEESFYNIPNKLSGPQGAKVCTPCRHMRQINLCTMEDFRAQTFLISF